MTRSLHGLTVAVLLAGLLGAVPASAANASAEQDPFADDPPLFNGSEDPFAALEEQATVPEADASDLPTTGGTDEDQDGGSNGSDGGDGSGATGNRAPGLGTIAALGAGVLAAGVATARRR